MLFDWLRKMSFGRFWHDSIAMKDDITHTSYCNEEEDNSSFEPIIVGWVERWDFFILFMQNIGSFLEHKDDTYQ